MNFKEIKQKKFNYEMTLIGLAFLWVLSIILGFVILAALVAADASDGYELTLVPITLVSGAMFITIKKFKKNSLTFKKLYVVHELKKILPDIIYEPENGLSFDEAMKSNLLKQTAGFESEDYLEGKMGRFNFKASDILLSRLKRSEEQATSRTYFRGQLFVIDLEKTVKNPVYLLPKIKPVSYLELKDKIKVELEWMKFNDALEVYADQAHDVFYMLTPLFMEKIYEAGTLSKKSMFSFVEDQLYIAIHTKIDTFDLKLFRPFNKRFLEEIIKEIMYVKSLIEAISL